MTRAHPRRGNDVAFSLLPARGEKSSEARMRGPLSESERCHSEPGGDAPSPRPSPRTRGEGVASVPASAGLFEKLAADQHAADFGSAGTDFVELGVAQQPAGREVVDVAVAAEDLDGFERHPGCAFGSIQDRAGGILARGFTAVAGFRD